MENRFIKSDLGLEPIMANDAEAEIIIKSCKDLLLRAGYQKIAENFHYLLEPGNLPGKKNYYLPKKNKEKLKTFIQKIIANKHIAETAERLDGFFLTILFENIDCGVIDSDRNFDFLVNNRYQRETEYSKITDRAVKRLSDDPAASEDELKLGIYKEFLETQVRDAIIVLNNKGYSTFQSGFFDSVSGSQFIDFNKKSIDRAFNLPLSLTRRLQQHGISIKIEVDFPDRVRLILTPKIPDDSQPISLDTWKEIWDGVANDLPKATPMSTNDRKPFQKDFTLVQEKIRRKQDMNLGYGVVCLDGKVQRMTREEFEAKRSPKARPLL